MLSLIALLLPALAEEPEWEVDAPHGPEHAVTLDLTEGTWMSVDVDDDGVLFDLLGDLWRVPHSGGEAQAVTTGRSWDVEPTLSPSGDEMAFVSDRDGNEQIWVMDMATKELRKWTDESVARVTNPVWIDDQWILGRRRTVDTRSIGVTELWLYHRDGGKGVQLTKHSEHPHAGEAVVHGDYIYFSSRARRFEYNHNPYQGLWRIVRIDQRTGEQRTVVRGAGGASRPSIGPNGEELYFISRARQGAQLEAMNLQTGERRVVFTELDRDEMEGFSLHQTYPAMRWHGDKLVLWAGGKLWRVGTDGAKTEVPFRVKGSWQHRDITRFNPPIPDEVISRVIRWPRHHADGRVVFSALGALWMRGADGSVERVSEGSGYSPAWSPSGKMLAWTSYSDADGGRLHLTDERGKTQTLPPRGQLVNPAWSQDGRSLVVLRGAGGATSPDLTADSWYEVVHLTRGRRGWTSRVLTTLDSRGTASRAPRLHLGRGRLWFMQDRSMPDRQPSESDLVSVAMDGTDRRVHLQFGPGIGELAISPDFERVAYKQDHKAFVTALPAWGGPVKAGEGTPALQVSEAVGDWLDWGPTEGTLTWAEGNILKKLTLSGLKAPELKEDEERDWDAGVEQTATGLILPRHRPSELVAYTGARVITMKGEEVIEGATVVVRGDRIEQVGGEVPKGARVVDVSGKTLIPGLIDVHAHLHYTAGDVLPEQEWRYLTALDYGVTTVHDPSASTDLVFTQAEMVEAGMQKGPRVYSTGYILYGALSNEGAKTPTADAARMHVQRLKDLGALSVKVYQQSRRDTRQWYVQACNELEILCVPEGGGDLWMNMGMVSDGFHAIEHSLPTSPVYADVQQFFAASTQGGDRLGTFYTPTLLVAYGGVSGENWFYQRMPPIDEARMRKHWPVRELEASTLRRGFFSVEDRWNHISVARDAASMQEQGLFVTLGAHGQLQGLGVHWELWALASDGAMTAHEALRAGTIDGARYLGLDKQLGSIEAGKLADFVVLDANPLDDIHHSDDIAFTVKNGEVFE